jgi:hypothetical protein
MVAVLSVASSWSCATRERASRADSVPPASAPSSGATVAADAGSADWHLPAPGKPCASTGLWGPCTILERLDRAGLAPRVSPGMVREPPLERSGHLIRLGGAELKVFVYDDSMARRHDEERLDRKRYIEATQDPTLRNEATLIRSANLLAILNSRSDTQRERVALAITAGPPQSRP